MSMHISAKPGEIAPNVLLPGDPLRAKYIAEKFLDDAVCINEIRGMHGYTGTYKGQRVTVMATGMGIPSMMIYATELCREYGCKKLVRIGTCGNVSDRLRVGDLVIASAISTTSGINLYNLPGTFAPTADFELLHKAFHCAVERGITPFVGNTLSNDYLYVDDKPEYLKRWAAYGVLACEQEGAGLYSVAAKEGVKAVMLANVVCDFFHPDCDSMSDEEKERGLDDMILIALDTVTD